MPQFETLDTLPALKKNSAGCRVLLRGDLNVPMRNGLVTEATRIERLAPTILELADRGCKVIVMSHFDRPKGIYVPEMSTKPLLSSLRQSLGGREVVFLESCIGEAVEEAINALPNGGIALLENLRFYAGEENNDPEFIEALASLGDIYVNDAFSAAHRAHASTAGIAQLLPSAAGRSMQMELEALERALGNPKRPVLAVVGGAKVSTKLDVLSNLVPKVEHLVIGGAMANTFLHALGSDVGASLCEFDMAGTARDVMAHADEVGCKIILPADVVIAKKFEAGVTCETVPIAAVRKETMILDIGEGSARAIAKSISDCKTILWNGPLGAFEIRPFDNGTNIVAQAVAKLTVDGELQSIAGGGDTVAALSSVKALDSFSYVSTAGGAFLEWLEGRVLPGVAALEACL
ncbi:MAG: phosphoglycerate kinase [Rhodospirillaceae bacterium]|nr:phosphoglycerate kinase [Rhodospirillaceae bacterium]|tara:strand:- start:1570 stop:2787 length:1218 start_codon:yes stop_codon:yes gene_type:complete